MKVNFVSWCCSDPAPDPFVVSACKTEIADSVDLAVQYLEVPGGRLYSEDFASLVFVLSIDIRGEFVLHPDPTTGRHNYRVELYLSLDDQITPGQDLKVSVLLEWKHLCIMS